MIPHERSLVKRYRTRPFALIGINNDRRLDEAKAKNEKIGVTWRNVYDPRNEIAGRWNLRAWPTLYLIDHAGVIRAKWRGKPKEDVLDRKIEALVEKAERARRATTDR